MLPANPAATCYTRKRRLSDILSGDPNQTVMSSDEKCKLFLALARPEESHRLSSSSRMSSLRSKCGQTRNERMLHGSDETKPAVISHLIPAVSYPDTTRHTFINNISLNGLPQQLNDADAARQSRNCVVAFTENGPIRVTAGSMPPGLLHQLAPPRSVTQTRPHPLHMRLARQQERMREARRVADRPPSIVTPAEIHLFNEMVRLNSSNLVSSLPAESPRRLIQDVLGQPLTKVPVGLNTDKIIELAVSDCFLAPFALYKRHVDLSAHKLELMSKCVVCYQEFDDNDEIAMLPCVPSHIVHSNCLRQWLKQKLQCPFCRADFPSARIGTVGQSLGVSS